MNHSLYGIGGDGGGRPGEREVPRSANYAEVTLNATEKRCRLILGRAPCEQRKAQDRGKLAGWSPGLLEIFDFRDNFYASSTAAVLGLKKTKNKNEIRVIKYLPALYLSRLIVNTVGETPILNAAEKTVVDVHIDIY